MKKLTLEFRLVGGFATALLLLLLAGGQMYRSLQEYMENSRWVVHTYQVLDSLGELRASLFQLESGQRTYLITGDAVYLQEHQQQTARIADLLAQLRQLTADNPRQELRSAALTQQAEECLRILSGNLALYRSQGFAATQAKLRSGEFRLSKESLLKQAEAMEEEERALLTQRSSQAESNASQAKAVGALLVAITLAGLFILWWRLKHEEKERGAIMAATHESELLKQIIDLLPVGVFVADAAGNLTQINPAARAIWGGERRVGLGNYSEYTGWWPDSGKLLGQDEWALARTLISGEIIRDELVDIRCFDGSRKTIASHAMPIRNEQGEIISALAVNIDVTSFKRTERQLRATAHFDDTQGRALALFSGTFDRAKIMEGLLALLAEQHPFPASALYGFDEWSGRYRCEAAYGLSGAVPREFVLGEGLLGQAAQLGKTTSLDCTAMPLQTGLADFSPVQVLMIPVSYQERRLAVLVLAASSPLHEGDLTFLERLGVTLGVALDNLRQYSDLQLLATQLRASSEEIAVKNLQLEEASRMKSEFLANMSHELRTPLNAIIGFAEALRDGLMGDLSVQQREFVTDIFDSGSHLLSLINDILDLSKVEAGKMELELEPVPIAGLLQGSLQVVREKAIAHHLRLTAVVADDLGEIWVDERKLKQILYNLLSNAVKFSPEGKEVRLTARQVGRAAVPHGDFDTYLEIAVCDSGIGISAEDQLRLFQPFTQIDSTLARRYEGTGLGLVMVKRLTELHGGKVALQSAPGQGSTFTVWLPWRHQAGPREDLPVLAAAAIEPPDDNNSDGQSLLALVVEDDDKAAALLRLQLESTGFRVVRATAAETALELAVKERPDLLTLDIHLPGMDGWEFLERFKQQPQFAGVPVVIVSIIADKSRGLSLGAAQVLQKPVGREELARALTAIGFPNNASGEQHTILLVDDDPKAVQLLTAFLNPAGFRVLSAFGGQEGIDVAKAQQPDLIVLDLMMPEVNGFDVVAALKQCESTAQIPVIIVSAKQITAEDRALLDGDVLKVIEKSEFTHGRFIDEVKRAMAAKGV